MMKQPKFADVWGAQVRKELPIPKEVIIGALLQNLPGSFQAQMDGLSRLVEAHRAELEEYILAMDTLRILDEQEPVPPLEAIFDPALLQEDNNAYPGNFIVTHTTIDQSYIPSVTMPEKWHTADTFPSGSFPGLWIK